MAKSYASRAPGLRSVRLDLDEADHARLRVLAASAGQPMSQYVRGLVEAHIRRKEAPEKSQKKPCDPVDTVGTHDTMEMSSKGKLT